MIRHTSQSFLLTICFLNTIRLNKWDSYVLKTSYLRTPLPHDKKNLPKGILVREANIHRWTGMEQFSLLPSLYRSKSKKVSNDGRSHSGSGELGERPVMAAAGSARYFDDPEIRSEESGGIGGSRGGCGSGR